MRLFFLLHFLIETIFGVVCLFTPESIPVSFFHHMRPLALHFSRIYSIAAIALGLMGLLAWRHYTERAVLLVCLPTLAVFHTGIMVAELINPMNTSETNPAILAHSVLAVAFWTYFFKER